MPVAWRSSPLAFPYGTSSITVRIEQPNQAIDDFLKNTYPGLYAKATHTVAKPGDKIAVAGLEVVVVSSAGEVIKNAVAGRWKSEPGLRQHSSRPTATKKIRNRSAATSRSGKFRTAHLGDLADSEGVRPDVSEDPHRHRSMCCSDCITVRTRRTPRFSSMPSGRAWPS